MAKSSKPSKAKRCINKRNYQQVDYLQLPRGLWRRLVGNGKP
jgi:hypothetical protein